MLLRAVLLLLLLLADGGASPQAECSVCPAAGDDGPPPPSMESLRTTCPKEVAACEADADCMEELLSSFASQEASPELPSDLLVAVFQCFNANAEMAHSCPREMEVCEATAGCVDELQAAVTAVAPPTEGSEELMAVVECLKRVSAERASAQQKLLAKTVQV